MNVTAARYENGELILSVPPAEARKLVYGFKPGDYNLVKSRKRRSLDANAYCWVLINLIAEAVSEAPETVYRQALRDIPGIVDVCCVQDEAVDSMIRLWTLGHIGRRVDVMDSKIPGCKNLFVFYGSSDFTQKQMSVLIDNLIQDCRNLGIETRPEAEIRTMLEAWHD